jgi:hypothetical protein
MLKDSAGLVINLRSAMKRAGNEPWSEATEQGDIPS